MSDTRIVIYNTTSIEIESRVVKSNSALARRTGIHICPCVDDLKASLGRRNGHRLIGLLFLSSASEIDSMLELNQRGLFEDVKLIISVPEMNSEAMDKILCLKPRYYCDDSTDPAVLMILLKMLTRESGHPKTLATIRTREQP